MTTQNERNTILLSHLSGFGGYLFPFGSVIIPLIIRETQKDKSENIDVVTKDVVNFNLSYLLYSFVLKLSMIPFFIGTFFQKFSNVAFRNNMDIQINYESDQFYGFISIASILSVFMIIKVVLIIHAAIKANKGEKYKYPLAIKFIK